jgi:hypothetical protein
MKGTELAIFYHVGKCIAGLGLLETMSSSMPQPMKLVEAVRLLNGPDYWLKDLLTETEGLEMPDTRAAVITLRGTIRRFFADLLAVLNTKDAHNVPVDTSTLSRFKAELDILDEAFTRECKHLDVFTVTPKGLYSTRALIQRAETKFPPNLIKVMSEKTISDTKRSR